MMKIVALIPYWLDYEVNEFRAHKNLKKLAGKYLINYSIEALNAIENINETIVYCSDCKIKTYINENLRYKFLERDKSLDNYNVSIDKIIQSFLYEYEADIIILLHPNSPFLSSNTISECLEKVKSKQYDSALTAYKYQKFAWFDGDPLNYELNKETPHLSVVQPVIIEQSSLYIFTRESFNLNQKRIGQNPYMKIINHFEGHEIQTKEDFDIAELIVNSGMYPKVDNEND